MSANYAEHFSPKQTSQLMPIPGKVQEKNNAGGYSFTVDKWEQMLRFLILGSEGGTYYSGEAKLSAENAANTVVCIQENTRKAVDLIIDIATKGRAAKQDSTIFALALACTFAPEKQRPIAYQAISIVCKTGTQLFTFTGYVQSLRGWSRGLRSAVSKFYTEKDLGTLELQIIKYRNREGFTHRDVIRLAHPSTLDKERNELLKYAVGKVQTESDDLKKVEKFFDKFKLVNAFETAKTLNHKDVSDTRKMVELIVDTSLPREAIPTQFLGKTEIWNALLVDMPINALVRNLGKMSSLDMTKSNLSPATILIAEKLRNPEAVKRSRIHPMQILTAIKIYQQGHGDKGSLAWQPNQKVIDALNDAFYLAFGNVEPTNKNIMLALDTSGSMAGQYCAGSKLLDCREAAAAMAMITARTEPNHDIIGFTSGGKNYYKSPSDSRYGNWEYGVSQLAISPNQRLDKVVQAMTGLPHGGTDCALPMLYAMENKIPVDTFVIYTDNETWAGRIHPSQALEKYRQKMGRDAKLAVVAMTASKFTIADPKDNRMLDVVGFDTATPSLLSQFTNGFNL